jgi:hypothetical protein
MFMYNKSNKSFILHIDSHQFFPNPAQMGCGIAERLIELLNYTVFRGDTEDSFSH